MKRGFSFSILAAVVVGLVAVAFFLAPHPVAANATAIVAQEPPVRSGPSLDPTTMEAILVLVGGGIVTLLTEGFKKLTKATGILAVLETGFVAVLATGFYFLVLHPPFDLAKFILYGVAIFGEATGYFHFYQKRSTA